MDTFNECAGNALVNVMNSPLGQELTDKLLTLKLVENPHMTQEEWTEAKQGLLVYMFAELLKNEPPLMREYAGHMYHLLRGEARA